MISTEVNVVGKTEKVKVYYLEEKDRKEFHQYKRDIQFLEIRPANRSNKNWIAVFRKMFSDEIFKFCYAQISDYVNGRSKKFRRNWVTESLPSVLFKEVNQVFEDMVTAGFIQENSNGWYQKT